MLIDTARLLVAGLLALLWFLSAVFNGGLAWQQIVCGEDDGRGFLPLFGGLAGSLAVVIAPISAIADRVPFVVIPFVLDFGSLPYVIWCGCGEMWSTLWLRRLAGRNDVNARDRFGRTPLHAAALLNSANRCRQLLERGADPAAKDRWGQTPLDRATIAQNNETAEVIAAATGVQYRPLPRSTV